MGDNITEVVAEQTKEVGVELYRDAAKPSVVAAGSMAGRLVRLALSPVGLIVQGAERLVEVVERRLYGTPQDQLQQPPATIAAQAAFHYALLGEGEETSQLREMFENLLMSSMHRNTATAAHPAFVSIISQLTQEEAWLLKSINQDEYPYMEMNGRKGIITLLGASLDIPEDALSAYISNLSRLGIIAFHDGYADSFENAPAELAALVEKRYPSEASRIEHLRGGSLLAMQITPFGRQFISSCVRTK